MFCGGGGEGRGDGGEGGWEGASRKGAKITRKATSSRYLENLNNLNAVCSGTSVRTI